MAIQTIGIGSAPNDGTGDAARTAFGKVNDNFAELYGIYGSEVETQTFTSKQDDLAINDYTRILRWNGAGTTGITGIAAPSTARVLTIVNASTDYLLWLENQNTASSAGNRFALPDGFFAALMPGDTITVWYDLTSAVWRVLDWPTRGMGMGFSIVCDYLGEARLEGAQAGTGASSNAAAVTGIINTTERPVGVAQLSTGTTTTGRAIIGNSISGSPILPTLGAAFSLCRVTPETAVDGTETYTMHSGFGDMAAGTFTDGICWEYRWTGSAIELAQTAANNTTLTRATTGSPTITPLEFIWLGVFMNADWTRADMFYSTDSVNFVLANSLTTGLPGNTRHTAWAALSAIKSAGTTARLFDLDVAALRISQVRA